MGRDSESGLITGERLLDDVDRMIADAVRFGRPLSVAVAGLSAEGGPPDAADILRVAGLIQSGVRTCDLAGRLDDGMFLLALSGTPARAAVTPLTRLQQEVAELAPATSGGLRVAVGVAALSGLMSMEELVVRAIGLSDQAQQRGPGMMCLDPEPAR